LPGILVRLEFHQAVKEVVESSLPFFEDNPKLKHGKILERLLNLKG